ncbi:MAG: DUF397 domain-containing protein [Solirubrobacteraceae bacterium]
MRSVNPRSTLWRKSSYSAANGDCVEVGLLVNDHVGVRDSKDAAKAALGFTAAEWRAFVGEVKRIPLEKA